MRSFSFVLLSSLLTLVCGCAAPPLATAAPSPTVRAATVTLAENKTAKLPIVIAADASDDTKAVAAELQKYLNQISGADFKIQTGDGKSGIVLGTLKQFPHPELEKPLEMRGPYDGREAYAIRSAPGQLLLIGRTDLGTSHAAFRLLETLGVRWFFPAPDWEVVPQKSALSVSVNETDRPKLLSRRMFVNFGFPDDHGTTPNYRGQTAYIAWKRHNRMAHSLQVTIRHVWDEIERDNKAAFDAHPEYYALIKDEAGNLVRRGPKFELANPAVRQMFVEFALKQLRADPTLDMANIDPSDGGGWSISPESQKLGSVSDALFGLANEVARAVQKEFPGKLVGLLAYNYNVDPPSFALEPNVYVELAAGFINGKLTLPELKEEWPKKAKYLGYYEYFSFWPWDQDKFPGGNANDIEYVTKTIRDYAAHDSTSLTAEAAGNCRSTGRSIRSKSKCRGRAATPLNTARARARNFRFHPVSSLLCCPKNIVGFPMAGNRRSISTCPKAPKISTISGKARPRRTRFSGRTESWCAKSPPTRHRDDSRWRRTGRPGLEIGRPSVWPLAVELLQCAEQSGRFARRFVGAARSRAKRWLKMVAP